jgi:hypothetical protein
MAATAATQHPARTHLVDDLVVIWLVSVPVRHLRLAALAGIVDTAHRDLAA